MANNFGMRSSLTLGGSGLLSSKTPSTDGWACPDGQLALPYVRQHPAAPGAAPHAPEIAPLTPAPVGGQHVRARSILLLQRRTMVENVALYMRQIVF